MQKGWIDEIIKYPWKGARFKWDIDIDEVLGWLKIGTPEFWQNLNNTFKVPYEKLMEIIFIFGKELRQPYSEVLKMPWYEVEMIWAIYEEWIERQNKQNKMDNKQYEKDYNKMTRQMPTEQSMSRMIEDTQNNFSMPTMPDMNNIGNLNNFNF